MRIRIRIQQIMVNVDPDVDSNKGFWWPKIEKKKFTAEKNNK